MKKNSHKITKIAKLNKINKKLRPSTNKNSGYPEDQPTHVGKAGKIDNKKLPRVK